MTSPSAAAEDRLVQAVSSDDLMEMTAAVAQWVRLSGEPDELESFRWVETRLRSYGYETELLFHPAYISLPGPARLEVAGEEESISCITHAFAVSTPASGLSGRLVACTPDGPCPDARGRIVLMDGMASGVSALHVESLGALAQIHVHDDHLHETSVSPVWGNPSDRTVGRMPTLPGISIRRADGERLRKLLATGAVEVVLHAEVLTEWRRIPLLVADLPGIRAEEFVLLSSHIDSWYYGAMDNGSANATALEVARLLRQEDRQLRRGLRLCFWSGHSHGRFAGSAWYADHHWQELHQRCVAHVFVDSTGGRDAVIVSEAPVMPQTHALAAGVIEKLTGEAFTGKRIGRFADQSFYGVGLNSVFGTLSEQDAARTSGGIGFKTGGKRAGGLGWWWHTPDDTVDKVDPANLVRDTRIYLATVYRLLTAPLLPFDYRPAVAELQETTRELAGAVAERFDLSPLTGALKQLQGALEDLYGRIGRLARDDRAAVAAANAALLRLSRHLVPIAFHENGRYEHDPMEQLRPLPALQPLRQLARLAPDSDEAYLLETRLRRALNWILDEAGQARQVTERCLAELT